MKGCLGLALPMARFDKLPKFKVPKVALPRRKAAAAPEAPPEPLEAASTAAPPGLRFTPLEFRPAGAAPERRDAPPAEAAPLAPAPPEHAAPAEPATLAETALVEETARAAPAEPAPPPTVAHQPVESLEGIGPVFGEKLRGEGVNTVEDLVAADADHLARRTGISAHMLAKWQAMGRLQAVSGIGPQYSELLARAGVASLEDLARWDPGPLAEKLVAFQSELDTRVEGNPITPGRTAGWIEGARAIVGTPPPPLPPEVAPEPAPAPAPVPAPEAAAEAPKPRFALPFGRKSKPGQADAPPEASPVKPARRFSLSLGRKKDAPALEAAPPAPAPEPAQGRKLGFSFGRKKSAALPPAEAAPPPAEASAPPPPPRKLGFTLGRKKPEAGADATASAAKRKLGFELGRKKPAQAAPPAEPAPVPPEPFAERAAAAKTVAITLPVPPAVVAAPPPPEPEPLVPEPEPVREAPAWVPSPAPLPPTLPTIDVDFDYVHLRVDRILSERSPYRVPAAMPDASGVDDRVDDLLGAKGGKRAKRTNGRKK